MTQSKLGILVFCMENQAWKDKNPSRFVWQKKFWFWQFVTQRFNKKGNFFVPESNTCPRLWMDSSRATLSETLYHWRKIEPVTMKANFIHFWCVKSEFIVKHWFHNWTSVRAHFWKIRLFFTAPVQVGLQAHFSHPFPPTSTGPVYDTLLASGCRRAVWDCCLGGHYR